MRLPAFFPFVIEVPSTDPISIPAVRLFARLDTFNFQARLIKLMFVNANRVDIEAEDDIFPGLLKIDGELTPEESKKFTRWRALELAKLKRAHDRETEEAMKTFTEATQILFHEGLIPIPGLSQEEDQDV